MNELFPLDVRFDLAIRFGPLKDTTDLIARKLNDQHLIITVFWLGGEYIH